jgi:hypothetical protein
MGSVSEAPIGVHASRPDYCFNAQTSKEVIRLHRCLSRQRFTANVYGYVIIIALFHVPHRR